MKAHGIKRAPLVGNAIHTRDRHMRLGCPGSPRETPGYRMGRAEAQPDKETIAWPACPCDRCWKRAFISDTRPASGTRRWRRSSSASATRSTSSISRRRCRCTTEAAGFVRRRGRRRRQGAVRRHQALGARGDRRRKRAAAACPTSTSAGSAACSPISRPSANRSSASKELDEMPRTARSSKRSKKEAQMLRRETDKLERSLGGIKEMDALPDALFVDRRRPRGDRRARGQKLGIPVVAIVDTNCAPDGVDYVIPGNDDAMRAIQLYAAGIADAVHRRQGSRSRRWPSAKTSSSSSTRKASRAEDGRAAPAPAASSRRRSDAARRRAPTAAARPSPRWCERRGRPEDGAEAFMARRAAARKTASAGRRAPRHRHASRPRHRRGGGPRRGSRRRAK